MFLMENIETNHQTDLSAEVSLIYVLFTDMVLQISNYSNIVLQTINCRLVTESLLLIILL